MKLCMTTAFLFFLELQAIEIVERPNGEYFITGRGCGISNPIKYLKNFPPKEKLEDYECSFVQLERGTRPLKFEDYYAPPAEGAPAGEGGAGGGAGAPAGEGGAG